MMMSKTKRFSASLILYASLSLIGPAARGGGEEVFKGLIADSQCAMNVHSLSQSHKEMLQGKDVGRTDADCVWYCVKERGGRFVLQIKARVYKLDKQDFGREYAGHKVQITGTLDPKTNTIHVRQVGLLPEPAR
jgi:uncharacterized protein YdeI (BOF family)